MVPSAVPYEVGRQGNKPSKPSDNEPPRKGGIRSAREGCICQSWTSNAVGGQKAPNPSASILRNVVIPHRSPRHKPRGRDAVRRTDGGAGTEGEESECRPVTGRLPAGTPWSNITQRESGQTSLLLALDPIADPNSYGFRKGRSCADAMAQCYNVLGRSKCP